MPVATAEQLRRRHAVQVDLEPGVTIGCRQLSRQELARHAAVLGVQAENDHPLARRALIDRCVCAVARSPRLVEDDTATGDRLWVGELSIEERGEIFSHALGLRRPGYLAPFVPSPAVVVDAMLALAGVTSADTLYDLGCGDGRIVIAAARAYGAAAVGIDYDADRLATARAAAATAGVNEHVTFIAGAVQDIDLSPASVVTLYLLSRSNLALLPHLRTQLKPGTRIVSHDFAMGDWAPEATQSIRDDTGRWHVIYRWTL